ncbi:SIS domain-containing protein [Rhizobium sp. BK376]|uniref:SIS domain-containing protein n=1 Tax=Rhizobium sp. BK376 TaxID=2512149 RepID=UPI00104CEDFA|nr:SIS domain-containing protein [Rhizobium sp. BK376]TCR71796.1 SIS domain-containing protein [Rhizobium sp. BK376]
MSIEVYMSEQGQVIENALNHESIAAAAENIPTFDRVILIGSGSSLNALTIVRAFMQACLRRAVEVINPAVFLKTIDDIYGHPLVVVLSQSGRSTTSVEAVTKAQERGWHSIVITADPTSPIGGYGSSTIHLPIGDEPIGPKTKGFTASVAACLAFALKLADRDVPSTTAADVDALLEMSASATSELLQDRDVPNYIAISGTGRFLGVAMEASLKIAEIAGLPTAAFEPEELLHGRLHGATTESLVIMIADSIESREEAFNVASVMGDRNVHVALLNLTTTASPYDWLLADRIAIAPFDAVAAVIPFQRLAVDLALRQNMVPDEMRYPGLSRALAIKTFAR